MNLLELFPEQFEDNVVGAEAKDMNVLIMRRLSHPIRRFDGKKAKWELEYRWLSKEPDSSPDAVHGCVRGIDFSYWRDDEWDQSKPLLEQFSMTG